MSSAQVYFFTEIENRPHSFNSAPRPPLQEVYPKSIQNIVAATTANEVVQPKFSLQFNSPAAIPASLPSIVHDPNSAQQSIQSPLHIKLADFSRPVIRASYSNHKKETSNALEKIVVKVVKAPGWYLNDSSERSSYYNAVAHGLLGSNGLVYVNNVQKVPFDYKSANNPSSLPFQSSHSYGRTSSTVTYSPNNLTPPNLQQSQPAYRSGASIGTNYWQPCTTYSHYLRKRNDAGPSVGSANKLVGVNNSQQKQRSLTPTTQTVNLKLQTDSDSISYDGHHQSSYDVRAESVGRLPNDNSPVQYNLGLLLSNSKVTR